MRLSSGLLGFVLVVGASGVAHAAPQQAAAQNQEGPSANVDQLAQRVFTSADRNHNHVLNRSEFADAQVMLNTAIADWGREGLIGKPKKASKKDNTPETPTSSATTSGAKLAKSNKVSQAEFTFYVHSAVDEADQQWRQMRATAALQQKALNAQRSAYPRRGRARYPVSGTPNPFAQ